MRRLVRGRSAMQKLALPQNLWVQYRVWRGLTGDASLRANEALLLHKARVAAQITVALAQR